MSSLNASRIYPMGMKDTLVQVIQPHVHGYLDGYSASVFETYGYVLMYTSSFPIQTPADIQKVLFVQLHRVGLRRRWARQNNKRAIFLHHISLFP
jgi:hypothetical protein